MSVSADSIKYLQKLQLASIKYADTLNCVSPESCETLLLSFLQYHIEEAKYLKSLKFLKNIQSALLNEKKIATKTQK